LRSTIVISASVSDDTLGRPIGLPDFVPYFTQLPSHRDGLDADSKRGRAWAT
jgi:hypothetical protein